MKKFIIFALGLGILAILAADTVFVALGTASAFTIAETAVGWAFVLAVAIAAVVKTVNGSWPFPRAQVKADVDYLTSRIDELEAENDELREVRDTLNEKISDLRNENDTMEEKIAELNEKLASYEADPESDPESNFADEHLEGLEPVIATTLPDGKLQDLYTLPPEPSVDEAYAAACASLEARATEGNPVENPRIRFRPVYL